MVIPAHSEVMARYLSPLLTMTGASGTIKGVPRATTRYPRARVARDSILRYPTLRYPRISANASSRAVKRGR